ncbi:MAG TPA: hypothetical protein VN777_14420 [Terriglobales bacterium]|jgi:hypothetical protein|nr:hypothetical protein [Terriglobales bacterium]
MIGVIASPADHDVVREFFELFKTPWELYRGDQRYDVVICAGEDQPVGNARLVVFYGGRKIRFEDEQKAAVANQQRCSCVLRYGENRIPIYGDALTFSDKADGLLTVEGSQETAAYLDRAGGTHRARVGYDLFAEVRTLLTAGQPSENAGIPSLELHIAFLRDLITACGISLIEIPPVPEGFRFIACLTHDVDHPSIRQHKWDHTIFGFLYRALFSSLHDVFRDRLSLRDAFKNWTAAVKLPFVYTGYVKDYWRDFDDRYLELEKGLASTFFVIPYKNQPGETSDGSAHGFRASGYEAKELEGTIRKLMAAGCEVALHGIDAWIDSSKGRAEIEEIRRLTGSSEIGVRMHWLYYNEKSPAVLEKAGAAYDSTVGYNETVGYRAGTTQVYKPLEPERLLELPMHVMDTALFYPSYLALSPKKASAHLEQLMDNAAQFGGCLTINWHDRSLAPERLWGDCYRELIQDLKMRGAWFATASQATSWFRKRRSAAFELHALEPVTVRAKVPADHGEELPGLRLRIHKIQESHQAGSRHSETFVDRTLDEGVEAGVASEARI